MSLALFLQVCALVAGLTATLLNYPLMWNSGGKEYARNMTRIN